jgi:Raf kinase inhibitor-like YbhB/YbcL family protein
MTMQLTSPSFADGAQIPDRFTRDGEDIHPPLEWTGVPAGTKSFAIVCEDIDAPSGTFVHWVLVLSDPTMQGLAEGAVVPGSMEGRNDFGEIGYGGPQPPEGDPPHRYVFSLLALRSAPLLPTGVTRDQLCGAIASEQLGRSQLIGWFRR